MVLLNSREEYKAITSLEKARKLLPWPTVLYSLGLAYAQLGKKAVAIEIWGKALEVFESRVNLLSTKVPPTLPDRDNFIAMSAERIDKTGSLSLGFTNFGAIKDNILERLKANNKGSLDDQAQFVGENTISSLTSDIKPDSWVTFYLFYFNQGLGSDASFQLGDRLVHIFVEDLMSAENNEAIIEAVDKKHELASGEFIDILIHLSDYDLDQFKSSAGSALVIEKQSGKAKSTFFKNKEDIKVFVMNLRSQGAQQLH
jgi:tetratricopeptide (TPR) repeat protein